MHEEKFGAARRASSMTCEDAGSACGMSRITYAQRELNPAEFRLSELKSLYRNLSDTAKPILVDAVGFFIYGNDYIKRN